MVHISEEPNDFKIIPPKMLCDETLSDDIPPMLPNRNHFLYLAGAMGSGKSSTVVSLLTAKGANKAYRKVFHNIYFIIPPNSRASLASKLFQNHPEDKIYDELNPETLQDIHNKVMMESSEGFNSLVILDDVAYALKKKFNEEGLEKLIKNHRHLRTSVWIIGQTFVSLPLSIRKCISHMIMVGKPRNKKEYESVFEELMDMNKNEADAVMRYVFQDKHDQLYMDKWSGNLYRNFNKLNISE
jgi:energy-coupling factor transporter ATP-binding protein EcfA2